MLGWEATSMATIMTTNDDDDDDGVQTDAVEEGSGNEFEREKWIPATWIRGNVIGDNKINEFNYRETLDGERPNPPLRTCLSSSEKGFVRSLERHDEKSPVCTTEATITIGSRSGASGDAPMSSADGQELPGNYFPYASVQERLQNSVQGKRNISRRWPSLQSTIPKKICETEEGRPSSSSSKYQRSIAVMEPTHTK